MLVIISTTQIKIIIFRGYLKIQARQSQAAHQVTLIKKLTDIVNTSSEPINSVEQSFMKRFESYTAPQDNHDLPPGTDRNSGSNYSYPDQFSRNNSYVDVEGIKANPEAYLSDPYVFKDFIAGLSESEKHDFYTDCVIAKPDVYFENIF
jgi:hypothetical protein